jgi:peptidyl-prolyl cis-trans isomerase C
MPSAMARHILLKTKEDATQLKRDIAKGADFSALAKKHSICPSKKKGGDLGEVRPGDLVKPVEQVIFKNALKVVHGPIKSKFGFHLIQIYFRQ